MSGEKRLFELVRGMTPKLNSGEFVFSTIKDTSKINREETICEFKETEGTTIIIRREKADKLNLSYDFVAAWITLKIHSSLKAVGLTALFSGELTKHNISCNVIAGYYHDHIFVDIKDSEKAVQVLTSLSKNYGAS